MSKESTSVMKVEMDLITKLRNYKDWGLTVRPIFSKFGVTDWKTLSVPFEKLSEMEVTNLLMNWATKANFKGNPVKLRLRDTVNQEVYEIWIKKSLAGMNITRMERSNHLKHNYFTVGLQK